MAMDICSKFINKTTEIKNASPKASINKHKLKPHKVREIYL
jgi:hypothetical protein